MRKAIAAGLCLGALFASVASAQRAPTDAPAAIEEPNAADAKRLFQEGVELLAAEHWTEAEARFRQSVELMPRASSLYNWALSLFGLERYDECVAVTDRLIELAGRTEQTEYRENAAALRARALSIAAQRSPSAPAVESAPDPAPAPLPATPVPPAPAVLPEHAATVASSLLVAPQPVRAGTKAATAAPARAHRAERSSLSPAWFVVGAGALALAGAVVTAILANSADDDFTEYCPHARNCDPSLRSVATRAKRFALATDILLATGAVGIGTGLTLLWLDDGSDAGAPATPRAIGVQLSLSSRLP